MRFDFDNLAEETAEIEFKRAALNEIDRYRRIDEYIPSYRNLYTRAALFCQKRLMEAKVEPRRLAVFMPYIRPGNLDEVRLAAFEALIDLGMLRHPSFMHCALHMFYTEPSPYMRDHFWALIERGFGLIALGEPEIEPQPASNGFVIAEGESAEARQERAERTGSLEGALRSLQRQLADNETLQEALMDALRYVLICNEPWSFSDSVNHRSRVLGLKEFDELLNICHTLYTSIDSLQVKLSLPRYYKVESLGNGLLRFSKTGSFRSTVRPSKLKELKRPRPAASNRSQSPEAKRRRTSIPNIHQNLSPPLDPQASSLPSPTSSHQPPQLPKSPESGKQPPAVQKPLPPVLKPPAPTRKASTVARKPQSATPKTPATMKTIVGRQPLILRFPNKELFRNKVAEWQASSVPSALPVTLPPVLDVLPSPTPKQSNPVPHGASTVAQPPAEPTKLKLKIKFKG
jgi:transcription initiation factor TFIID subunit 2